MVLFLVHIERPTATQIFFIKNINTFYQLLFSTGSDAEKMKTYLKYLICNFK